MKMIEENPYKLDTDENGAVALTKKNVEFINGILQIDSSYRDSFDKNCVDSSAYIITEEFYKNGNFVFSESIIEKLVKAINKENSTHLFVANGVEKTISKIMQMSDSFKEDLLCGKSDLIEEIANATDERNNFSFATKFCSFTCRYAFEGTVNADNYCIYDNVISSILPYYVWRYVDKKIAKTLIAKKNSRIEEIYKNGNKYDDYRCLIDAIINSSAKIIGEKISRADFDSLLWYCYKGRNTDVSDLLKIAKET